MLSFSNTSREGMLLLKISTNSSKNLIQLLDLYSGSNCSNILLVILWNIWCEAKFIYPRMFYTGQEPSSSCSCGWSQHSLNLQQVEPIYSNTFRYNNVNYLCQNKIFTALKCNNHDIQIIINNSLIYLFELKTSQNEWIFPKNIGSKC